MAWKMTEQGMAAIGLPPIGGIVNAVKRARRWLAVWIILPEVGKLASKADGRSLIRTVA